MSKRRWTDEQLKAAVTLSYSYRNVIRLLGLVSAGGNYDQVKERIKNLNLSTEHFKGMGWNKGIKYHNRAFVPLDKLLIDNTGVQSYKLKTKLIEAGIKKRKCEMCGWATMSVDGRIPVELDHINGNKGDNRLENLRILCPNCHSLQTTHRGKNKMVKM
jgi:Zn finger protein HypA/HybF involved in hydrogenase expression